jgi:Replication-relaxation
MRYRKGYITLSDDRDVPLLLTIRNARAITYEQICSLALLEGRESSRRSLHWRLARLERCELVQRMTFDRFFSQPIFAITPLGLEFLESRGHCLLSLPATTREVVRKSQILHSVELAGIRAALASNGILKSWKWELEIVSTNLVYESGKTKDYDALVEVSVNGAAKSFAIEFERTLKGAGRYEDLRRIFSNDQSVDRVLYLTPNREILYVLAIEMREVGKQIGFALSRSFQTELLDASILTNLPGNEVLSFRDFLLQGGFRWNKKGDG